MAKVSYRYIAHDLLESFKQLNDDSEISLAQVVFWVNIIANRLRMQHIRKLPTGTHLTVFQNVPITVEPNSNRKFFTLPSSIYDYEHDLGIDYITYQDVTDCCDEPAFTQVIFGRTTSKTSQRLYFDQHETPSAKNPYFYRVSDRIFLLGLECIEVPKGLEVGLYATIDTSIDGCNLDDEIDLSEELLTVLKYEVLNLGRFALIIPNERINEGADQTTQAIQEDNIKIPTIRQPGEVISDAVKDIAQKQ